MALSFGQRLRHAPNTSVCAAAFSRWGHLVRVLEAEAVPAQLPALRLLARAGLGADQALAEAAGDIADFYAWHTTSGTIVAVITVQPLAVSGDAPLYDADVLYGVHVDTNLDNTADIDIYARVSAEHKLRVVRAWQRRGAVVDMARTVEAISASVEQAGTAAGRHAVDISSLCQPDRPDPRGPFPDP